jgi:hypothetical protein
MAGEANLNDPKARTRFKKWLRARKAEVLAPTICWELMRFRINGRVGIIWQGKGGFSLNPIARDAYDKFTDAVASKEPKP